MSNFNFRPFRQQTAKLLTSYGRIIRSASLVMGLFLFAAIGSIMIRPSQAATVNVAAEPELGSVQAPAATISDGTASAGKSIKFTAAAAGARTCPAYPAMPDASCTGTIPGTTLAPSGELSVTQPNAIIENLNVNGTIYVQAPGVTIRNVKAKSINTGGNRWPFVTYSPGTTIQDVEIDGRNTEMMGIDGLNFTARRVNIHGTTNGFRLFANTTIEDSYVHDLYVDPAAVEPHLSALGSNAGANFVIRHSSFDCFGVRGCSGALVLYNQPNMDNVLVEQNFFKGGSFCVYPGGPSGTNVDFINNRFDRVCQTDSYGPASSRASDPASRWENNVWHDTGQLIP